jgi:transposase-like protein
MRKMGKSKFTVWCPNNCGKKVFYEPKYQKSKYRYLCPLCRTFFSVDELENFGNNMNRVHRLKEGPIKVTLSPELLERGINNEW